ncbi:3-hydroxyacyl-CoA dehydrogenase NAD-binding domain-containing protein [Luminiphilus sp.]|nr:3-hydroxyacyl-CoA dehydrogenase NAD-binding domain-containing protein [Luminiphilus sp.]
MGTAVTYERQGQIGVIRVNNPPVNALSHAVRSGIMDALATAADDASLAVVLACDGRTFIAGADITEFGKPPQAPSLPDLLLALDNHPKLTIAAIHGTALGGGFEVALTCNYRIALATAKVGLPEVKLGLLPGAGGTQRTPRLAGLPAAVDLITSGNPIAAENALSLQLVDKVVGESLVDAAVAYASELVEQGAQKRQASTLPLSLTTEDEELIASVGATLLKKTRGERAPQRILDCLLAAATQPFEAGLKREREEFMACLADPQSTALRHMFFAERAAGKIDSLPKDTKALDIASVGIIGAGTMGGGIAMCFAQAGIKVTLVDMTDEAVKLGLEKIAKNYAISVKRGRLTADQTDAIMANMTTSSNFNDLAHVDMVIEAVFENLEVKKDVFAKLDGICKPGAVLASNTSYQSIDAIAAATTRPESVLGMHFFSPANVMKLLEVVKGAASSDTVIATSMAVGKKIGKVSVLSGMCYGFIGNRMLRHYGREASLCLIEGSTPSQIDSAMESWGMAMGPLAVSDLAGLDIGYKAREQLSAEQKGDPASYRVADRLVEAGRLGQKSGAGYYQYDPETRQRQEDPAVMAIVTEARRELGITPRQFDDEEIVNRLTLALANEGAKLLQEGIAQRASDIDVVYCYGYGFPRFKGGPMHTIESMGLDKAVTLINEFRDQLNPEHWQVAPLLKNLVANGGQLADYHRD